MKKKESIDKSIDKWCQHLHESDSYWQKKIGDAFEIPLRERISQLKAALLDDNENFNGGELEIQTRGEASIWVNEKYGPYDNLIGFIQQQLNTGFVAAAKWALDFLRANPTEEETAE